MSVYPVPRKKDRPLQLRLLLPFDVGDGVACKKEIGIRKFTRCCPSGRHPPGCAVNYNGVNITI